MKLIAIYNQNCARAGQRALDVEAEQDFYDGDVTWYGESDLEVQKDVYCRDAQNSNELYLWNCAREVIREFDPEFLNRFTA